MRKIFLLSFIFISAYASGQVKSAEKGRVYGAAVNDKDAISVTELDKKLETDNRFTGKVEGKVVSVCQEKGCWMKLAKENGENIMIRFKDYKFFVPKDIDGKKVVLEGIAKKSTTSVEMLRHYAKDAGKTDEEVAKIKEPKEEVIFTASGVLVL